MNISYTTLFKWLALLVSALLINACAPGEEQPPPSSSSTHDPSVFEDPDAGKFDDPAGASVDAPPPAKRAPATSATDAAPEEPDWDKLKMELVEKHRKTFVPVEPGTKMMLVLKSGVKKPVMLEKVEGSTVHVVMAEGNIGYPAAALHPSSKVKLFELSHAQFETLKELREIQAQYEKEKAAWEAKMAEQALARAPRGSSSSDGGSEIFVVAPQNDPNRNGAVPAVVAYLKDYVRNPETIRFKRWGKVQETDSGWRVSLEYEFSTETMKNAVTHKWFLMDKTGRVYRTALYKDPSSLPK